MELLTTTRTFLKSVTPLVVGGVLLLYGISFLTKDAEKILPLLGYTLFLFSIPLWIEIIVSIYQGKFGVDLIAGLALIVSFLFGQYVAGAVVLLMLSGGEFLEVYAATRARKALSSLLSLLPTTANIKTKEGIKKIESKDVVIGTVIVVRAGEVIPVDGVVEKGESTVDESILTGESVPVLKSSGSAIFAGTTNGDGPLEIKVTKPLSESRLEGIITIVRKAEEDKAPFVRMADTYSVYFTLGTLVVASLAWIISQDEIRLLAVLVVATPCPLILATPIAFLSGISAASRRGVIVKNGGALEAMAKVDTFVFDKTGTITLGVPKVHSVKTYSVVRESSILEIAASLDQLSVHTFAHALASYAQSKPAMKLSYPESFRESFGDGVEGVLNNVKYIFGKFSFLQKKGVIISDEVQQTHLKNKAEGIIPVYLSDGVIVLGVVYFKDEVRADAGGLFAQLQNIKKATMLLTGDKEAVAKQVVATLSINSYKAECTPEDKLNEIEILQKNMHVVAMIGDGVNDAPALAKANVGIALGSHGATAASDTADMVIISGTISRVYDAFLIARHSVSVARQGILIGIGLSSICMIIASFGGLTPVRGALVQEGIDIMVILYALRASVVPGLSKI